MPVINLFKAERPLPAALQKYVIKGTIYSLDRQETEKLFLSKPAAFTLRFQFENKTWDISLKKSELFSKGFTVKDANNRQQPYDETGVLYYKGKINNSSKSFAAVSILHDQVIAVLADESGNINIGALTAQHGSAEKQHIIYREADLISKQPFECFTGSLPQPDQNMLPQFPASSFTQASINSEPVDIYFEADYKCYQNNASNITTTVNWATALFNVVTTLYDNDSVNVRMSGIKVWNIPDPYVALTTTSTVLPAFASNMSYGFPGDIAHLLSQRSLGGGIAYLNTLCSSAYSRTSVSGNLSNSFSPFPTYSWSTMVITHELGHNLGSNHTQWCGWPGGAIDNCYATEGGCAQGPAPVNGGTIMSYCHLTSYGINLANGFGPLPGAVIRNNVRTSTCIYPKISFSTNFQTVTEENADVMNGCHNYKLINLKLGINYTPTQPAVISLIASNVGTPGLVIGTNGDVEVSPMNFTLTDTTKQTIQLKVYDDAIIEDKESLKLDYTIAANGTNALKNSTYQLDILSLDHRPDSAVGQLLYYEPFDTIPTGAAAWTQTVLYGALSPNRWTIGNNCDPQFTNGAAFVSANGSTAGYAGSSITDSADIRFESPVINANGFSNMHLGYLLKCYGEGGVGQGTGGGTAVDFGRVYYSVNSGASWILLKDNIYYRNYKSADDIVLPAAADNSPALKIAFEWLNNRAVVNNPGFIVDSIRITGTSYSPVQSAANAANTEDAYLGPDQTVHFYNKVTGNIMATIVNKSSFDFGCTTVDIIRTGNSASAAWGNYAAQKVADKSYRVIPANTNAAAPFEISLYYTAAEINGWAAATGNTTADMAIIKTSADITQSPPASAPVFSNYNSINNYGTGNDKFITGRFTGFSTFSIDKPGITTLCPGSTQQLSANETALSYQWQVNTGSGYTSVIDDAVYNGSATASMSISNAPTSWYGYRYRCVITDALGTHNSIEYILKFESDWLGTANTAWENAANWNCGTIPDANTDVFVKAGAPFWPVVNLGTTIRSFTLGAGAVINVLPGVNLIIRQ